MHLPNHWGQHSPDRNTAPQHIPHGTTHFRGRDSKNAYHACGLGEETKRMCVSRSRLAMKYKYLLQAECGTQGVAAMGTFFPAWMDYGYKVCIGEAWVRWMIQHVDDGLAHGPSEERCQVRWEIMVGCQDLMGLKESPTHVSSSLKCQEEHVGMLWTPEGVCITDSAVEYIQEMLKAVYL